jgi:hypothetical protein
LVWRFASYGAPGARKPKSPLKIEFFMTPATDYPALPLDPMGPVASASRGAATLGLAPVRRIRIIHFCSWAGRLQEGAKFLAELPHWDLRTRVSDASDPSLLRMARLDCDWHGEHVRAFGAMRHDGLEFLPAQVVGVAGAADPLAVMKPADEEWWFVITAQHPQMLGATAGRLLAAYARHGIRTLYYAFDEASRTMPCFSEIAPHLSVLIHDEAPLANAGAARLRSDCRIIHRSWVANLVPFAAPFVEAPDEKILFLGSKLGLTAHRERQIEFLRRRYGDRFHAICDHSLAVGDRTQLGRFKVSLCPEGRKFDVPAMSATHTDRPFWSGCLGMIPVSEDSAAGGRLEELHRDRLIVRYPRGDLKALGAACDRALAATVTERRRIYDHFNRQETVGSVVGSAIDASGRG